MTPPARRRRNREANEKELERRRVRNGGSERAGAKISGKRAKRGLTGGLQHRFFALKITVCFFFYVQFPKVEVKAALQRVGADGPDWMRPAFKIRPCQQV